MAQHVILASVNGPAQGYTALEALRRLGDEQVLTLRGAAVIERRPDGRWHMPEETEEASYTATLTGGALGGLIGLLVGPAGLLLGAAAGAVVGGAAERHDVVDTENLLHRMPRLVRPGTSVLVADVDELSPTAVDAVLEQYASEVERFERAEVEQELAALEQQRTAR